MTAKELIKRGFYDLAVDAMDDEIREKLHDEIAPCTDEEFLIAYLKEHKEKYDADFIVVDEIITIS